MTDRIPDRHAEGPLAALEELAELCGLGLHPEELPAIREKLHGILAKFESIQGLDIEGLADESRRESARLREDGKIPGEQELPRASQLLEQNAPELEDGPDGGSFYRVPSILDN